jgi:hypothetical protein
MAQSFGTTRSMAWHEIFWVMLARHEHEGHAVPRISARAGYMARPAFWAVLGPARPENGK